MTLSPIVTGIGFNTQDCGGDPGTLEAKLSRMLAVGSTHAELSLGLEVLVVGGRPCWPQIRKVRSVLSRVPLTYTAHGPLRMNLMDRAHRSNQMAVGRAAIEAAAEVGATLLNIHSGFVPPGLWAAQKDSLLAEERECLAELGDLAEGFGISLAVENTFNEPGRTGMVADPAELGRSLAELNHANVIGCLDVSHSYIMASQTGRSYLDLVSAFAPQVGHLHLVDCFGRPTDLSHLPAFDRAAFGEGDLHLPLGWGDIPWEALGPRLAVMPGTVMILEVAERYWAAAMADSVARARSLADSMVPATLAEVAQ